MCGRRTYLPYLHSQPYISRPSCCCSSQKSCFSLVERPRTHRTRYGDLLRRQRIVPHTRIEEVSPALFQDCSPDSLRVTERGLLGARIVAHANTFQLCRFDVGGRPLTCSPHTQADPVAHSSQASTTQGRHPFCRQSYIYQAGERGGQEGRQRGAVYTHLQHIEHYCLVFGNRKYRDNHPSCCDADVAFEADTPHSSVPIHWRHFCGLLDYIIHNRK